MTTKGENQQERVNGEGNSNTNQKQKNNFGRKPNNNRNNPKYGNVRNSYKGNQTKNYAASTASTTETRSKIIGEETFEDIKKDILRIEKEIELEIKQIRSCKLGL